MKENKLLKSIIIITVIILSCYYIFIVRQKCIDELMERIRVGVKIESYFNNDENNNNINENNNDSNNEEFSLQSLNESFANQEENNQDNRDNEEDNKENNNFLKIKMLKYKKTNFVNQEIRILFNKKNLKFKYLALPDNMNFKNNNENIVTFKSSSVKSGGSPNQFLKGRYQLKPGLDGQSNTYSFYNAEFDRYLSRDNKKCMARTIDMSNEVEKKSCSFYLLDGASNTNKCTISCVLIGKEKRAKYMMYDSKTHFQPKLKVVEEDELLKQPKNCTFDIVDSSSNSTIFYNPNKNLNANITNNSRNKNNNNKDNDIITVETFTNPGSITVDNFDDNPNSIKNEEINSVYYNPFSKNRGLEFYKMFNVDNNIHRKELDDQLFEKLMKSKMDKNVKNLLEFNESRHKIYKNENEEFNKKMDKHIKKNNGNLEDLITYLNNNRIKQMSSELFFLENKCKNDKLESVSNI